jgi:hypothetical protein
MFKLNNENNYLNIHNLNSIRSRDNFKYRKFMFNFFSYIIIFESMV